MRYLRMLSNSLAVALLASSFLVTLVLQLNPTLPLQPDRLAPIVTTVGLFYAIHLTAIFYLVLVVRQLLARELFSPAWLSVGVLSWMAAAAALAGAGLMWANLRAFELVLEPDTVRRMANGMLTLVMSSALFVFVALLRAHLGPAGRPLCGALLLAVWAGSVAGPLALRGRGSQLAPEAPPADGIPSVDAVERPVRITLIAIDGGSLDFVTGATAQSRLPNFGRLLDEGAIMRLETLRPTSAEAVWAAVATGKLPQKNGVRSAAVYRLPHGSDPILLLPEACFARAMVRLGFLVEQAHNATTLRTRAIWGMLGALGLPVGVVGWPLTHPAPAVKGFLVSDAFQRLIATPSGIEDPSAVYPPEIQAAAFRIAETASAVPAAIQADSLVARHQVPARTDIVSERIAQELSATRSPQVTMIRFQSLDSIGHYFLRYAMPTEFGDVSDEERRRFGSVLEQHYGLIDDAVGRAMSSLRADDLLLVVSGYGMEPMGIARRVLENLAGDPDLSGTHDSAPDGFLMAYGGAVARARLATRGSIVDVAPTLLYFLGLPLGRDMDGQVRTELFQPSFTAQNPITYIPTYDR